MLSRGGVSADSPVWGVGEFDAGISMDEFDQVVDRLYDGAVDAGAWPQAMSELCQLTGGGHALAIVLDRKQARFPLVATARVDPAHLPPFLEMVPWGMTMLRPCVERRAIDFDSVIPRAEFLRSDFFNDVIRPMNGYRAMLTIPFRENDHESYLAICRPAQSAEFDAAERALLQRIAPHLTRAMRTRLQLDDAKHRMAAALGAFDQLDTGLAIVDRELRPVVLNRRAARIVADGDGLARTHDGLEAMAPSDRAWLRQLVQRAAGDDPRVPGTYAMRLHRAAPRAPWLVTACRLAIGNGAPSDRLVMLLIESPSRPVGEIAPMFIALYGLSAREAAIAAALLNGSDLAKAAESLGIARGTARTHLKAIFAKTGTHRQAELVALLLRATRFSG